MKRHECWTGKFWVLETCWIRIAIVLFAIGDEGLSKVDSQIHSHKRVDTFDDADGYLGIHSGNTSPSGLIKVG
jgi:hypothetical protein